MVEEREDIARRKCSKSGCGCFPDPLACCQSQPNLESVCFAFIETLGVWLMRSLTPTLLLRIALYGPKKLSEELRQGKNPHMTRRRWIIGLSMLGGSMGQAVTRYHTGIVNHLPSPPGQKLFDADRVDASNYAYNQFNSPD